MEGVDLTRNLLRLAALALGCASALACADLGKFVWVRDYPEVEQSDKAYVLAPDDVIQVKVFNQPDISTKARIRQDGKISLPLLNDVDAAGYTPAVLGQQLETRLKDFIKLPAVTVSLEETRVAKIFVTGLVAKPGRVVLEPGSGVLQVLILSGGLTEEAHGDRIFVMRGVNPSQRIRLRWEDLVRGDPASLKFKLQSGDVIVVE